MSKQKHTIHNNTIKAVTVCLLRQNIKLLVVLTLIGILKKIKVNVYEYTKNNLVFIFHYSKSTLLLSIFKKSQI